MGGQQEYQSLLPQGWDMTGHGLGSVREPKGAGQWDRGHTKPLGITRVVLFKGMSLHLQAQREGVSTPRASELPMSHWSWFPGFGGIRGRGECQLFCPWAGGRQAGLGVPLHPGSQQCGCGAKVHTHSSPPSCPQQGGDTRTSVPRVWRTDSPQGEARAVCVQRAGMSVHHSASLGEDGKAKGAGRIQSCPGSFPAFPLSVVYPWRGAGSRPEARPRGQSGRQDLASKLCFFLLLLLLPSGSRPGAVGAVTPGLLLPARGREKGREPSAGQILFLVF